MQGILDFGFRISDLRSRRAAKNLAYRPVNRHSVIRNPQFAIRNEHRGLSLFEVIISLAIFMASAAAIGQLVSSGVRGALRARLETDAILRCESTMAEVVAGILPLSAQEAPYTDDPNWVYSVSVTATPQMYLYAVAVSAAHTPGGNLGNISYTLSRLVRDPGAAEAAAEIQAELKAEQEAQSQSSSSTSSSSSSSSGGTR